MILMCPCIIDFIGGNGLQGQVGGERALDTPGPLNGTSEVSAIWAQESPGPRGVRH
jgi:hypothetical protein